MAEITITEGLAEIRTIDSKISKKREFIGGLLIRQDGLRDPMEKDGGSRPVIARERQAIGDLMERKLLLRRAIQQANEATQVGVNGTTRSIADWLVWKRDVLPTQKQILGGLSATINQARNEAVRKGQAVVTTGDLATRPSDWVVNLDEKALAEEIEKLTDVEGTLDGILSLKNATVTLTL